MQLSTSTVQTEPTGAERLCAASRACVTLGPEELVRALEELEAGPDEATPSP